MNYCRRCGEELTQQNSHIYTCVNNHTIFANASPSAAVLVLDHTQTNLLMAVRGIEPRKGMLDAFGGFLDGAESIASSIEREMLEEAQLTPDQYSQPKYLMSMPVGYPFGGEEILVLDNCFWVTLSEGAKITPADDVSAVETISVYEVPLEKVHVESIREAIRELRKVLQK